MSLRDLHDCLGRLNQDVERASHVGDRIGKLLRASVLVGNGYTHDMLTLNDIDAVENGCTITIKIVGRKDKYKREP